MTIAVDSTRYSHVVTCSQCPGFSKLGSSASGAWQLGAVHEAVAHPTATQARDALSARNARG